MFIGNTKAIKFLNKAIENGKISHAYLFSGPQSVGKFTLAKLFSMSLILGQSLDLKTENRKNPLDLIVLSPEIEEKKGIVKEKEIKIERIRNVQKDLSLFPYEGKYKILIVNDAQKLTVSSQNALLKILEEPNETSIIILVAKDDSKILPTIKSRCQKVIFSLVDLEEMAKSFEGAKESILFSMGRPGLFFKFLEDQESLEDKKKDFEVFRKFSKMGINERLKMAEKMSANSPEAVKKMEFWMWMARQESLQNGNSKGFEVIEKIEKTLEIIKNTNANVRLVIENLFLEI